MCNPWKNTFTLLPLAPLTVFSSKGKYHGCLVIFFMFLTSCGQWKQYFRLLILGVTCLFKRSLLISSRNGKLNVVGVLPYFDLTRHAGGHGKNRWKRDGKKYQVCVMKEK
jgi:hypothetical protein